MYSPILRSRQSELLALNHLEDDIRAIVSPIIDVAAPSKEEDKQKTVKYVVKNLDRVSKTAKNFPEIFVDSSELDTSLRLPGQVHPLTAIADAVIAAGSVPIPVTGLHRDIAHTVAALAARHEQGRICLRLDPTDIGTASITAKGVIELLDEHDIKSEDAYLLLDLQCVHGFNALTLASQLVKLLAHFHSQSWCGVIIAAYGLPDTLTTAIPPKSQGYINRVEQDVFYEVQKIENRFPLQFGDYTTITPSTVELDWKLIHKTMAPKAIYTLENSWFVVRGGAFSNHPSGYAQYYELAKEIVALEEFCGAEYSYGDNYIDQRAEEEANSPGSPASWITACVNHHVAYTARAHM